MTLKITIKEKVVDKITNLNTFYIKSFENIQNEFVGSCAVADTKYSFYLSEIADDSGEKVKDIIVKTAKELSITLAKADIAVAVENEDSLLQSLFTENEEPVKKTVVEKKQEEKKEEEEEEFSTSSFFEDLFAEAKKKEEEANKVKTIDIIIDEVERNKAKLKDNIKGQDKAVSKVLNSMFNLEAFKAAFGKKSIRGTFLFAGPAGTGKTLLAEELAELMKRPVLKVNMSEYSDHESNLRFNGSNEVYKNGNEGIVTRFVKENPNAILIFDEVEKAHVNVLNLFLQIFNDGELLDNFKGKNVDFSKTTLIFTTNAGKNFYDTHEGNLDLIPDRTVINALRNDINPQTKDPYFPAPLISRLATGTIVMFNHLEPFALHEILTKALDKYRKAFEKGHNVKISMDNDVPYCLLYSLGGRTDARSVNGVGKSFLSEQLYEAYRQLNNYKLAKKVEKINFTIDYTGCEQYFTEKSVTGLVISDSETCEAIKNTKIKGVKFNTASTLEEAKRLLRGNISFIVLDVFLNKKQQEFTPADIEDIKSDGRELFDYIKTYNPTTSLYLLNSAKYNKKPAAYETLLNNGAKVVLDFDPANTESFKKEIKIAKQKANMADLCNELAMSNKTLTYNTMQLLSNDQKTLEIRLYNLSLKQSFNAGDSNDFVDDISRPTIKFSDVIGAHDAKETFKDFLEYLSNPLEYIESGARAPRGVLLYGNPGTGKTLLAKAVAGESNVAFISKNAADFQGIGAAGIKDIFARARRYAPAIIFIDEVDTIAKERTGYGAEESTLNALLSELDGFTFDPRKPVLVIAATNYFVSKEESPYKVLDPAFVRRFDRKIKIELPNKQERIDFIKYYLNKHAITSISEQGILSIANRTFGYSPADLEMLIEHAIRLSKGKALTDKLLSDTVDANKNGKVHKYGAEIVRRTAVHEIGHALIYYLNGKIPSYVTIVSRGSYGGYMMPGDYEEFGHNRQQILDDICCSLGGRAAELVVYGDEDGITTGPSMDLHQATAQAKYMYQYYGMVDGNLASFDDGAFGELVSQKMFEYVNKVLNEQLIRAKKIILDNKELFDKLVEAILDSNSLTEYEFKEIVGK